MNTQLPAFEQLFTRLSRDRGLPSRLADYIKVSTQRAGQRLSCYRLAIIIKEQINVNAMIHDRRIKLNRDFNFRSNCEQFLRMRNFSNPSIPIIESRSISHDRIVCFLKMIYICIRNYEITRRKNKQVPSLFISRSIKRYHDVTTQEEEGQLKSCSFKMMNGNRRR